MITVKAYYNGRAFIPFENKNFKRNQQAMIIIEDSDQKTQLKTSWRGIAAKYANTSLINKEKEIMEQAFSREALWLLYDIFTFDKKLSNQLKRI